MAIKSNGWQEIATKSRAGATRQDQCAAVIWLQGRTRKQQIAALFLIFFFCSTKLLPTFPLSARSGSPTPHLSSDPFQILSRAVMRAEAPVKQKEVWCFTAGRRCGKLQQADEVRNHPPSVDSALLPGFARHGIPGSGKIAIGSFLSP